MDTQAADQTGGRLKEIQNPGTMLRLARGGQTSPRVLCFEYDRKAGGNVRLSAMIGKEIININDGMRMGTVGDSDLIIDPESGNVQFIIVPNRGNFINMWIERQKMVIPWDAVKKIGREVMVVDLDDSHLRMKNSSF